MPLSTAALSPYRLDRLISELAAADAAAEGAAAELTGDGRATLTFTSGTCTLTPSGDQNVLAAAADLACLAAVQDALGDRLRHLACGEPEVRWSPPVAAADLEVIPPVVDDYLLRHCTGADPLLDELVIATRTATGDAAGMQVTADEGTLLTMLTRMVGAHCAVEVGVFTGYSSICIARGLAPGGRLLACDTSDEWTAIARSFWQRAGLADRIDLTIAPAIETLRALPAQPHIDIAFIDADKAGYPAYYQEIVSRLRPGGLIALDNMLLGGRVLDPACQEEHHRAIRQLNDLITADRRLESVMLPLRDGLTLARRR